jgi:hypothetical protein
MAEALGLTASVIAVVQITKSVIEISNWIIKQCQFYIDAERGGPSHLRVMLVEVSATKGILENLLFLVEHSDDGQNLVQSLSGELGPIEGCYKSIDRLRQLFPLDDAASTYSTDPKKRRGKANTALATLTWALKESRAKEVLEEITRYKSTITLALTTDSLYVDFNSEDAANDH